MGTFLKALAKVGLVELEEGSAEAAAASGEEMSQAEIQKILAETKSLGGGEKEATASADPPTAPSEAAVVKPVAAKSSVEEGRPLEEIYAEVGIQPSPFPAEKLLKLLDGLRAMDGNTRKQAIIAMDQADDAWTIEDAILDADRKTKALRSAQSAIKQTLESSEAQAKAELEAQDNYQKEATETIRAQIAELEATLQKEVEAVAEAKATVRARVDADRSAADREATRLEAEVSRLAEIGRIFKTEGS